jgi:hypothetical protein
MLCSLIALALSMEDCLPPPPKPLYNDTFAIYSVVPDCMNRDRHIRYLERLKDRPTQWGDTVSRADYDQALSIYIERLEHYCQ